MTELWLTRQLLDGYRGTPEVTTRRREAASVAVLVRHGSRADADALLPVFLADPAGRRLLLPVLAEHGDLSTARRLLAACTHGGRLRDGAPEEVLHAVGYLGFEPAAPLLWAHAEAHRFGSDDAYLGLLHLSCDGLAGRIAAALDRHRDRPLFPELLPVLAVKTGDVSWAESLVDWGWHASTDCNGGLILGVALFGAQPDDPFLRLLWDPRWEVGDPGTGSGRWAYLGARALGLDLATLYRELRNLLPYDPPEHRRQHLRTFAALLERWMNRPWYGVRAAPAPQESADDLYTLLFDWSTPHTDDSLVGLATRAAGPHDDLTGELRELGRQLGAQVRHELELRTRSGS